MSAKSIERHIPSTFYEIIAYFGSGSLFVVLASLAMVERDFLSKTAKYLWRLDVHEQIGLIVLGLILTYAYGQLSSTLSAPFIAMPVGKIVKKLGNRFSSDFRMDFSTTVAAYGLADKLPQDKVNNKWTLMFYLQVTVPDIGKDIMKRYAREKLARINAFNMLLLMALSVLSMIGAKLGTGTGLGIADIFKGNSPWWTLIFVMLLFTYCYEYYKRKCWNNDLLIKVLPVALQSPPQRTDMTIGISDQNA